MKQILKYLVLAVLMLLTGLYTVGGGFWASTVNVKFPENLQFAHRGVTSLAPENSSLAISLADSFFQQGSINGIELDVRLTADRVPVVFHDESLERLTGSSLQLKEVNFRDLSTYTLNDSGSQIISLDSAFTLISSDMWVYLDIKEGDQKALGSILKIIKDHGHLEHTLIASAKAQRLILAKYIEPNCYTVLEGFDKGKIWQRYLFPNTWAPNAYAANIANIDDEHILKLEEKELLTKFIIYGLDNSNRLSDTRIQHWILNL